MECQYHRLALDLQDACRVPEATHWLQRIYESGKSRDKAHLCLACFGELVGYAAKYDVPIITGELRPRPS